jgi:hypothetical protein
VASSGAYMAQPAIMGCTYPDVNTSVGTLSRAAPSGTTCAPAGDGQTFTCTDGSTVSCPAQTVIGYLAPLPAGWAGSGGGSSPGYASVFWNYTYSGGAGLACNYKGYGGVLFQSAPPADRPGACGGQHLGGGRVLGGPGGRDLVLRHGVGERHRREPLRSRTQAGSEWYYRAMSTDLLSELKTKILRLKDEYVATKDEQPGYLGLTKEDENTIVFAKPADLAAVFGDDFSREIQKNGPRSGPVKKLYGLKLTWDAEQTRVGSATDFGKGPKLTSL